MIGKHSISVVIVTHRRTDTIRQIVESWLAQPVEEVILCDCTQGQIINGMIPDQVKIVSFRPDLGNRTRHAIALLTEGDFVCQADDDFIPTKGFIQDLYSQQQELGGMVGIIGRRFIGSKYYGGTQFFASNKIPHPVPVDMVGVCYFSDRSALAYDMRGMANPINDLFWCCYAKPDIVKHVAATHSYRNLPVCVDGDCLFHDPHAREVRESFYQKVWESTYERRTIHN